MATVLNLSAMCASRQALSNAKIARAHGRGDLHLHPEIRRRQRRPFVWVGVCGYRFPLSTVLAVHVVHLRHPGEHFLHVHRGLHAADKRELARRRERKLESDMLPTMVVRAGGSPGTAPSGLAISREHLDGHESGEWHEHESEYCVVVSGMSMRVGTVWWYICKVLSDSRVQGEQ